MPRLKGEGITKISVKGFKSIAEECSIDIRPLTILAGANSSGKSSIMQPLLMLKQTLEAPYDPGPLLIDGPNVHFTHAEQFLSKHISGEKSNSFQIKVETCDVFESHSVLATYTKKQHGIEISEMKMDFFRSDESPRNLVLYPGMSSEEIKSQEDQYYKLHMDHVVKRSRCFLDFVNDEGEGNLWITNDIEHHIIAFIHLQGIRNNLVRTFNLAGTGMLISSGRCYTGTFENYVASVIQEWQKTQDIRLNKVENALYLLGLTGQVQTTNINDAHLEIQVGRITTNNSNNQEMVNIADVGLGVSQVLPVVVALIAAEPGQLVYIEQPELHLHPNAQVALAQVLADASLRGVRVVAETHSSLLLLGIQTLVAEGKLPPELVKLHWFSRNEDGITQVDSVDLDEDGTYGEWSIDFDDVDLRTESRYLDAIDNLRFGQSEVE